MTLPILNLPARTRRARRNRAFGIPTINGSVIPGASGDRTRGLLMGTSGVVDTTGRVFNTVAGATPCTPGCSLPTPPVIPGRLWSPRPSRLRPWHKNCGGHGRSGANVSVISMLSAREDRDWRSRFSLAAIVPTWAGDGFDEPHPVVPFR